MTELEKLKINANQAGADLVSVKHAIQDNGVEVPDGTRTSKYGDLIGDVYSAGHDSGYEEGNEAGYSSGYSAGQSSMVDESKLIPKTVSGSYISVDDVSEIPHSVGCKVESVNLAQENDFTSDAETGYKVYRAFTPIPANTTFTVSGDFSTDSGKDMFYRFMSADGTDLTYGYITQSQLPKWTRTATCNGEVAFMYFYSSGNAPQSVGHTLTVNNFQINLGTTALPYTPYVKPEEVTVTRCGKNLFDINGYAENTKGLYKYWLKPNTAYTLSTNCPKFTGTASVYFNGGSSRDHGVCVDKPRTTLTDENGYLFIEMRTKPAGSDPLNETYDAFGLLESGECWAQLEEGSVATEYEPYNGQTLTPSADGTVEGMTSTSPYMNIFSDTEGVNIEVTYNKSWGMDRANQEWWDNWQAYGKRVRFDGALMCYASIPRGRPRFDIIINGKANAMFREIKSAFDLEKVINSWGVVFDTSKCTTFADFLVGSYVTNVGELDCSSSTDMSYAFQDTPYLTTIKKLKLPTRANAYWTNAFLATPALANIECEGLFYTNVSFKSSPLTKASITSIINALSSTVTGQTLTLKLSAVNTAFETSSGAADGSTSAEFAALVATKTNWTITMI